MFFEKRNNNKKKHDWLEADLATGTCKPQILTLSLHGFNPASMSVSIFLYY